MTAEVFIPLEGLNIDDIIIHPPTSAYPIRIPTALISYKNSLYELPKLSIFTPLMTIHSWDSIKGRLEMDGVFSKFNELYEMILKTLVKNPKWSSSVKTSYDEIKSKLQSFIINKRLVLYINTQKNDETILYTKKENILQRTYDITNDSFHSGQQVRIALRFQGIVFLKNSSANINYRIQHQVASVYSL